MRERLSAGGELSGVVVVVVVSMGRGAGILFVNFDEVRQVVESSNGLVTSRSDLRRCLAGHGNIH